MRHIERFKSNKDIHVREATDIVSLVDSFSCRSIYIKKASDNELRQVCLSSIIGLLSLNIKKDDEVEMFYPEDCGPDYIKKIVDWFTE